MYQQETTIRQQVNVSFFFYIPSGSKFNFFTLVFLVKKSVKIAKIYCHTILDLVIENRPCHGFGSHLD